MPNDTRGIVTKCSRICSKCGTTTDVVGMAVFLLPLCWWIISMSLPLVIRAYQFGEVSTNAGGLIRWPVYALMPLGFALLGVQVVSELIKRIAFLQGLGPDPAITGKEKSGEEQLLEDLRRKVEEQRR